MKKINFIMIDYKDFVIPEFYWDYFVKEKMTLFINSYLKENNNLPSEDIIKNFSISNKETEIFKRMLYSRYCVNGNLPIIPNIPVIPEEKTFINVKFTINISNNINWISDNSNDSIIEDIYNGEFFDYNHMEIILSNGNDSYVITDLTKEYSIPIGVYTVTGYIGKGGLTHTDSLIININDMINIVEDINIYNLKGECDDIIICSDNEFKVKASRYYDVWFDSHTNGGYFYYTEVGWINDFQIKTNNGDEITFQTNGNDNSLKIYYI